MTPVTSPMPFTGTRVVPAGEELTAHALAALLEEGGMRLLALTADIVLAERAVAGEPLVSLRVVCQRKTAVAWTAAALFSHRSSERLVAHHHELIARREGFTTLDNLGAYLGGCLSIPFSRTERAAIVGDLA